jgi:TetR/AcrR family fatty acid metabolism transcriptional regulator
VIPTPTQRSPASARLEARREVRRQRLLAAALDLFADRGFHDTSVDDVVAAARMSKSAFYAYFESKEDCFRVLLEQEGGALIQAVLAGAGAARGHRARLRAGVFVFVGTCCARHRVARLLLVEGVGLSASIEAVRGRLHAEFAGLVEAEVRSGQADGEFAGVDPAVYGRAVVGAVNEAIGWSLRAGEAANADQLAGELCRIFGV